MIKIEHANIQDAADKYSIAVSTRFNERLKSIHKIIAVLLNGGQFKDNSFKGVNFKTLCSICTNLSIHTEIRYNIKKETLFEILNRTGTINSSSLTNVNDGLNSLDQLIVSTKLFSATVDKLKGLNKKFKDSPEIEAIPIKLYSYLFDYNHYKDILDQYIANELSIVCCPYCNRNYITYLETEVNGKKIFGPTYDHFFHKSEYLYLTISFFNLVPSCYVCNSSLKGEVDFNLDHHLSPFEGGFGPHATFDFDPARDSKTGKIDFKPKLIPSNGIDAKMKMKIFGDGKNRAKNKTRGNVNVFRLNQIYETHSDLVKEIYDTFDKHSEFEFLSIKSELKKIGIPESEFYNYYFKNYFDEVDYHKRPLSKMTKEIYEVMKEYSSKRH